MKSMKRNVIVSAFLAIALCLSVVAGATFALFTSSAKVNLSITSATVKVSADVENLKLYSTTEVNPATNKGKKQDLTGNTFLLGGTANFTDGVLTLDRLAPGDGVTFDIKLTNKSNIDVKYRVVIGEATGGDLADALDITVNGDKYEGAINTEWNEVAANADIPSVPVKVELPVAADNDYAEKTVSLDITVEVVQASIKDTESAKKFTRDTEYKLTGIKANGGNGVLRVTYGTLTINGVGTLKAVESSDHYAMAIWANGANSKVIINGGKYVQEITGTDTQYDLIYASDKATIEIYGGTFQCATPQWTLNCLDNSGSKIYVMGGKFYKFNPAEPHVQPEGTEEIIVPEGYEVKKSGDWYSVVRKANVAFDAGKNGAYETLNDAITNASKDGNVSIKLPAESTVTLDNGIANESAKAKDLTFVGDGTQIMDVAKNTDAHEGATHLNYQRGSKFTFKNMTIVNGENTYDGIVCDELVYENCTITGVTTLYGKATFINCTFENDMPNQYSIWTWGGTDVKFENCTFNTNGKAILLYGQATAAKPTNLTVNNCTFNDRNNGSAGKAAIEIGNDYNATYTLTINNITVNGFANGKNTNSKVWANKNSMDAEHLTVTIDGTKVQ
ncbi:MAG: right-handed parallel beta-helix repeat-containing protein [Candidatus Borkfalkiaceae bacterium]|nr:right-handed parallel beta-helix repeat-containing protein [Christensenellaceae bacterium]